MNYDVTNKPGSCHEWNRFYFHFYLSRNGKQWSAINTMTTLMPLLVEDHTLQ